MEPTLTLRLATAALIGLVVGLEREWSGHEDGAHPRFAGLRTFFLIGLIGGIAGTLLRETYMAAAAALLGGVVALSVAAYIMAMRRVSADTFDGTTEMAAIAVLGLGVFAIVGNLLVAAGAGAIVVLMLGEKAHLHGLVRHITPEELLGALRFAVLALVVLPLLPRGPFGGTLDIEPRVIWSIVLLFSGLNYCGYVVRRILGVQRGYGVTGLLGGLVSSTAVTLQFSRQSRTTRAFAFALGIGVVGACTMLFPRVVVVSAVINPDVAFALIPRMLVAVIIGVGVFLLLLYRHRADAPTQKPTTQTPRSPLALASSLQMAVAFQFAISLLSVVRTHWGTPGLYAGTMILGLTDVDALTVSTAQSGVTAGIGAQAIMIGIITNTLLKAALSAVLGDRQLRVIVVPTLLAMAIGSAAVLLVWWQS